ncbi:hypothetical protein [Pelagerythrobacter marinus]|uniref:DUF4398 domain-containing protein n=1 Tax=Pelagerythrobacter marinus TaxID=538382 RepID=A0ABW9URV9_9SPHN|nr:hypothetical protein [Pelagerythrobacter marinus]MXO67616.1 hypothetical protein [Pelagerythrobacter marinus]USA38354.1 hypothetical protein NCF86_08375 [Pelagerythrobacter marinus]WPZ07683.1 hypothetical protein T8T98_03975 [Pelagerythrobacter marinus]
MRPAAIRPAPTARAPRHIAALLLAAPLAACAAGGGDYPSLAIRDAERVGGSLEAPEPADPPPAPAPPSAELLARVAQLRAEGESAHSAFREALPTARRAVRAAGGAPVETDRYAAAQVALADLDSHRSRTAIALGDLDALYAQATLTFEARAPIAAARDAVTALVGEQDAILARLRAAL